MFERFTEEARRILVRAQDEARALGHPWLGTEHFLLALLEEERGPATSTLRDLGVSREKIMEDFAGIVGPCKSPIPPALDSTALASIGIDLQEIRRRVEEAFGPGALEGTRAWRERDRLSLTPRSKRLLDRALREALRMGEKRVGPEHVLMAICQVPESLGARLIARQVPPGRVCGEVMRRCKRSA